MWQYSVTVSVSSLSTLVFAGIHYFVDAMCLAVRLTFVHVIHPPPRKPNCFLSPFFCLGLSFVFAWMPFWHLCAFAAYRPRHLRLTYFLPLRCFLLRDLVVVASLTQTEGACFSLAFARNFHFTFSVFCLRLLCSVFWIYFLFAIFPASAPSICDGKGAFVIASGKENQHKLWRRHSIVDRVNSSLRRQRP